jgi:hypothetical protein
MATSSVAMVNHFAADLGIPRESAAPRFGITNHNLLAAAQRDVCGRKIENKSGVLKPFFNRTASHCSRGVLGLPGIHQRFGGIGASA